MPLKIFGRDGSLEIFEVNMVFEVLVKCFLYSMIADSRRLIFQCKYNVLGLLDLVFVGLVRLLVFLSIMDAAL
jgi:hypothetical protein